MVSNTFLSYWSQHLRLNKCNQVKCEIQQTTGSTRNSTTHIHLAEIGINTDVMTSDWHKPGSLPASKHAIPPVWMLFSYYTHFCLQQSSGDRPVLCSLQSASYQFSPELMLFLRHLLLQIGYRTSQTVSCTEPDFLILLYLAYFGQWHI